MTIWNGDSKVAALTEKELTAGLNEITLEESITAKKLTFEFKRGNDLVQVSEIELMNLTKEDTSVVENPFSDVSTGSRFYKAILWAWESGITTGYTNGTFRPDDPVRRGEYITFQYRAAGEPKVTLTENPFSDVTKETFPHFYNAIMWAAEHQITLGKNGKFMPNGNSTRGDVVTFLYRGND